MFSGKTEELARRVRRHLIAKKKVKAFKPKIDNRYSDRPEIVSHIGSTLEAELVDTGNMGAATISSYKMSDIIVIDEIQFFSLEIIPIIQSLIEDGVIVIVSGLDQDFRQEPFGPLPQLLAIADFVVKLRAICNVCGKDATTTQRLVDGVPAKYTDETILVGERDSYEARCRNCHERGH
jgi:thymidine kinase